MNAVASQRGFTLVEVAVSLLLLTIGIAAAMGMIRSARSAMDSGKKISVAMGLAQSKMEELRSMNFRELESEPRSGEENVNGFTRKWSVRMDSPEIQTGRIEVTVEWNDTRVGSHRMKLVSVVSDGVVP